MYSSRDSTYAQQAYGAQSSYGQTPTSAYPGTSVSGADGVSQITVGSRHPSILAGSHERNIGAYRALPPTTTHYTGQYTSLYSSASLSSGQQASTLSTNSAAPSALEARLAARHELSKFGTSDYMSSSSLGYGLKTDRLVNGQYTGRQSAYAGRDLQPEVAARFSDSGGYAHAQQHQSEMYDRIDQAVLREQLLKSQSLQSASHDGVARLPDYITARNATLHHPTQELDSYGVRVESDPHAISIVSRTSYGGHPAPSILGAAPQRNVEDIMHSQTSSNPGYGVSLPPGRDYGARKGLHRSSIEPDDRKDERGKYAHDLDLWEDDRRRGRLREREKEREREREWERERERERDSKRECEKDRERKHILELRERERERDQDRERKRALEARRERNPPRVSKDRHSSLAKDSRSLRHDSPRHEALHRLHSPFKDKRREYVCKVYSSSLVDVEKDYLSLNKRYPRLYKCPDFSKLVVSWPKESLKLPFRTPVSFEHDFVEEETDGGQKKPSDELLEYKSEDSSHKGTVWNAKIILMSGLSRSLMEELSSDKISADRIPHICNLLRFAVLKKDQSFMAIGGQWEPIDGENPSKDDISLVRTALRYAKDVTQLNLHNCKHWNRFLEIHYDRVGKDGLFSHKEVTVLFIPDLSHCLPSLDAWRQQWLAHKKAVIEREKLLTSKKERAREKKESLKDKESNYSNDAKRPEISEEKKEAVRTISVQDKIKQEEVDGLSEVCVDEERGEGSTKAPMRKDGSELAGEGKGVTQKDEDGVAPQNSAKPGKKKIVRRIVKKVTRKKTGQPNESGVNAAGSEKLLEGKDVEPGITADPADVKTFTRRKVTKTEPERAAGASALKEDKNIESAAKNETQQDPSICKALVKSEPSVAASTIGGLAKKTVKRKIIKRVPKKKTIVGESTSETNEVKDCNNNEHQKIQDSGNVMVSVVEAQIDNGKKDSDGRKSGNDLISSSASKPRSKAGKVVQKEDDDKLVSGSKLAVETDKHKVSPMQNPDGNTNKPKDKENLSDGKEKKDKAGKDEPRTRSIKDTERKKSEEPPRPGFILQTRTGKEARLRSMSLSLDSLLDYSDKDVDESNFELSLFAESLYEMLQYQMGSRILSFLQKLRIKFVTERNQRKRHREETADKQMDKLKSSKRSKTEQFDGETSIKSEVKDEAHPDEERSEPKEKTMAIDDYNNIKMEAKDAEGKQAVETEENEEEEEEDPEEDPQEDEEMNDASPKAYSSNKQNDGERKLGTVAEPEELGKEAKDTSAEQKSLANEANEEPKEASKATEIKAAGAVTKAPKNSTVDRELLQAFRFFDRNLTGYIRLEDMRLIIHNLGKCLSHRDVKELAQSALLESNTGRDDRILYEKLAKMSFFDEK